jgi:hypothetical protein
LPADWRAIVPELVQKGTFEGCISIVAAGTDRLLTPLPSNKLLGYFHSIPTGSFHELTRIGLPQTAIEELDVPTVQFQARLEAIVLQRIGNRH